MAYPKLASQPGTYVLLFKMKRTRILQIGRLGRYRFPKGYYAYVGSALGPGGIRSRIHRHLRPTRMLHWHVDYLQPAAVPVEVWITQNRHRKEHLWAAVLKSMRSASIWVPGFGSSDCKCAGHLVYYRQKPAFRLFKQTAHARHPQRTVIYRSLIEKRARVDDG
jgi:Uri superfamily endonuclease